VTAEELKNSDKKIFIEGNAKVLSEYFQKVMKKTDIKIAYFGDEYLADIIATQELNEKLKKQGSGVIWDPICVMEELTHHSKKLSSQALLIPHNKDLWGKTYFYSESYAIKFFKFGSSGVKTNFFVSEMAKSARYAIPSVGYLTKLISKQSESESEE
jgi:hypothetical protein